MKLINAAKNIAKVTAIGFTLLAASVTVRACQISQDNAANGQAPKQTTIATVKDTPATVKDTPATVKTTPATFKTTPATFKTTPATVKATPATVKTVKFTNNLPNLIIPSACAAIPTAYDSKASDIFDNSFKQTEVDQFCSNPKTNLWFINGVETTQDKYDRYHSAR